MSLHFGIQTVNMLFTLVFCNIIALSISNPLFKYPYVFLLEVGNEELEKTNTEQLRVSIPGGSLAVKYPGLGEGDTIANVRVSGIEFGTDLKVNIVDGGPGYKYVVLVFMGKPGVAYDAVVTLQTIPISVENGMDTVSKIPIVDTKMKASSNSYQVFDPYNEHNDDDSNTEDNSMTTKEYSANSDSEVMQSSSTFYDYAKDEVTDGDNDEGIEESSVEEQDENDDSSEENEDGDVLNKDTSDEVDDDFDERVEEKLYDKEKDDQVYDKPTAEQYTSYDADESNSDSKAADIADDSLYEKYQDLKPHFADGFRLYPQSSMYKKQYQVNSVYDNADPVELEQIFNDEKMRNDGRYTDASNSIDSDYASIEY